MKANALVLLLVGVAACCAGAHDAAPGLARAPEVEAAGDDDDLQAAVAAGDVVDAKRGLAEEPATEPRELKGYYYYNWYNTYYGGQAAKWYAWYGYDLVYYYSGWDTWDSYGYANSWYGWYDWYDWYAGSYYGGWYDWYAGGYYGGWYDWYAGYYSSWYDWYVGYGYGSWYDWYSGYGYGGFYSWYSDFYDWYDWYSWYSWYSGYYYGGGSTHKGFKPVSYSYAADKFTPGYSGYYYYYWYHYAETTEHWAAKLERGWSNWADIVQGASIIEASSFIETWKCHEPTALTNVVAMSQYRSDVCSNGDRRWIFAKGDTNQHVVVDLGQERQISEVGMEFGDAGERLPASISFSYAGEGAKPHELAAFTQFGSVTTGISEYVKSLNPVGVRARYIRWDVQATGNEGSAFLQLVAAGPSFDASPSSGYVVLVVIIIVGMLVVGALIWTLSKTQAVRRRFYRASKSQIAKENAEFSSDDSDSDSDSDSEDSDSDSSSDDPAVRKSKKNKKRAMV